eukprot:Gb_06243 [translate_table: standard]
MDSRLFEAAQLGDNQAMLHLVHESPDVLDQVTKSNENTALHVASRAGQSEFVSEILRIRPQLLNVVNRRLDTALHEAAREGHTAVVKILLEHDSHLAYKVNQQCETALFTASEEGHLSVVKQLLQIAYLISMESEKPDERTSLHAAAIRGHSDIIRELAKVKPGLVRKADNQGTTPLHSAASQGHLEVTRALLSVDPDICYALDGSGRTPLHVAAMKGRLSVLHEILCLRLDSAHVVTNEGETILHSAVENNQIEVLKHLIDMLDTTELINKRDNYGNTVLHLATRKKLSQMVRWLVSNTTVNVNALNKADLTALDILEKESSHSGAMIIGATLRTAEAKRGYELPPEYSKSEELRRNVTSIHQSVQEQLFRTNDTGDRVHGIAKELRELHKEGVKNAANTITVVAVLIATVTFTAVFTVPGGLKNDGPYEGTAIMAKTIAFKVFLISDTVALFASLMIVLILVTVVPFQKRMLMKLLFFSNKVMWVALGCTATTFISAAYVVVAPKAKWLAIAVCASGAGSMAFMFGALSLLVANHQLRKAELRRRKPSKRIRGKSRSRDSTERLEEVEVVGRLSKRRWKRSPSSTDSDIESSEKDGFHPV